MRSERVAASVLALLVAAVALSFQLSTYPNHDVAWVLWGTREMLHGAQFGRDIIEPNPPLAWYISMPTTAVAGWLGQPLDWTFRIAVALAGAASGASLAWLSSGDRSRHSAVLLVVLVAVALLLLPGREFGQREHLLAIAIIPYLALSGARISGDQIPTAPPRLVIGLLAGLGVALKPYFLAVPLLVEVGVAICVRPRPRLLRSENLAIAAFCCVYLSWVLLFERPYLLEALPLANQIYWSFNLPVSEIISPLITQLIVAVPFALVCFRYRDGLGIISSLAFGGLALSYLYQHKGYPYHLLPVVISTIVIAACAITNTKASPVIRAAAAGLAIVSTPILATNALHWWLGHQPGGPRAVATGRIIASVRKHAHDGSFLAVAVHPYPSFPAALYTNARYSARTNSQWLLPAVVLNRSGGVRTASAAKIESEARSMVLRDLAGRPDLVLIDTDSGRHTLSNRGFDFLSFYEEDPRFRSIWSSYREIEQLGPYRQFVRKERP